MKRRYIKATPPIAPTRAHSSLATRHSSPSFASPHSPHSSPVTRHSSLSSPSPTPPLSSLVTRHSSPSFASPHSPHSSLVTRLRSRSCSGVAKARHSSLSSAFTLLELLVVIGIIGVLTALMVPAFTNMKSAADITSAAYTIKNTLEQARTYAMANNTYTWVGFYEEDATSAAPTNATPPYPGKGRLLMATVCSIDGTKIFEDSDPATALPAVRIKQIGKLTRIEGSHLTEIGAPPSPTPSPTPAPDSLYGRPALPYTEGAPFDHYNRISSDNPSNKQVNGDQTQFPFSAQNYTFYKTVRFNPQGEANINSTYTTKRQAEIGLVPTHGNSAPTPPPPGGTYSGNVVAVQISGFGGNVKIYRR